LHVSVDDPPVRRSLLSGESSFARLGLSSGDLLVLASAFFFCTAIGPFFVFPSYTPRMVLLLVAALPGVVALVRLARRRDRAAIAACVLAVWILVAAFFSGAPRLALGGVFGRESSALIAIAALGLWALGRELSDAGSRLLVSVLLAALAMSALVGFFQILLSIDTGVFARTAERASGLTTNPVYFGSLMGGAAALAATRWRQRHRPQLMLGLVGIFAFAVNLSGSRVALGATVLVLAYITARVGWRRGWQLPLVYLAGTLVSVAFVSAIGDGGQGAAARVASGESSGRLDVWRYGWSAFSERPAFGWGLGRFRAAIQEHLSADFVREHAPNDRVPIIFDAHNIVVELAVALGVVGLVLAGVFAWYAGRRASGALAAFVVVIAVTWFLQPAALSTLPVAMIALGASRREITGAANGEVTSSPAVGSADSPTPVPSSRISAIALALGVVVALWLAMADIRLNAAFDARDARRIDAAAAWFPADPVISDIVAQAWFVEEEFDQTLRPNVLEWSNRTTDVEADRAYWWARLASRQLTFGDLDGAKASLDEALERQPWHSLSWALMEFYATRADDPALQAEAHSRLCQLGAETDCD
jgi:O-antigen ligase